MPIRDRITEIRKIAGRDLLANPANPRQHPSEQRSALRGILEDVGAAGVLLAYHSPRHGGALTIIDGHLRTEDNPDFLWTTAILDVNDQEADLILATHDPLGAMAAVDPDLMKSLLDSLVTDNADVQQMLDEIAKANALELEPSAGLTDPDAVPAPPNAPVSQSGDLWTLGKHRLLVGDSSKPEDLDRLLAGDKIHLVNTDPPYNVKVEPRSNNAIAAGLSSFEIQGQDDSGKERKLKSGQSAGFDLGNHPEKVGQIERSLKKGNKADMDLATGAQSGKIQPGAQMRAKDRPLANDFFTPAEFQKHLNAWFSNLARVLLPGHAFYIWGGYANLANYPSAIADNGLKFGQCIIWDKQHPVLNRKDYMCSYEICFYGWQTGRREPVCWLDFKNDFAVAFYGWKTGAGHRYFGPDNARDLWHIKKVTPQNMIHLTEKPVELAVRAMQFSSKRGENVLDLFGGSGSTLIAAEMTGRQARLMEIDLAYADVICQRFLDFTGLQPVRGDGSSGHFQPSPATAAA